MLANTSILHSVSPSNQLGSSEQQLVRTPGFAEQAQRILPTILTIHAGISVVTHKEQDVTSESSEVLSLRSVCLADHDPTISNGHARLLAVVSVRYRWCVG